MLGGCCGCLDSPLVVARVLDVSDRVAIRFADIGLGLGLLFFVLFQMRSKTTSLVTSLFLAGGGQVVVVDMRGSVQASRA